MKKLYNIVVFLLLLLIPINVNAYSTQLIPGGQNIGIEIDMPGLMVVGFYKVDGSYNKGFPEILVGDYITHVNGIKVSSINEMVSIINNTVVNDEVSLKILRDNEFVNIAFKLFMEDNSYKTGLYVKESISGIGTMTYIDPETLIYGALGHEIIESNSNKQILVENGYIFDSEIINIDKSIDGDVGSKSAKIDYDSILGSASENTNVGIFGVYEDEVSNDDLIDIAYMDEVELGIATIYTTLSDNVVEEYEINITKIDKESRIKNFYFEVIDENLIKQTGGIVQGMSGSPIIQNDKIIGAVTHVLVDDVKKGFGVSIITMLEEGEN